MPMVAWLLASLTHTKIVRRIVFWCSDIVDDKPDSCKDGRIYLFDYLVFFTSDLLRHLIYFVRWIACQVRYGFLLFGCLFSFLLLALFCILLHVPLTLETYPTSSTSCTCFRAFRHFALPRKKRFSEKRKSQLKRFQEEFLLSWVMGN